jgi:hypothetical protein
MAFTVYSNNATVDGTALVSGSGALSAANWLYGFVDGSQRARFFYSSSSNTIALPLLAAPPVIPLNFVGVGNATAANCVVYQLQQTGSDYGATVAGVGPFMITLTFAAGSPDSASPFQFTLDSQALLLVSSTAYNGA